MKHEEVWGRTRRSSEVGGVTVTRFDDDRTGSIWKSPLQKQVFKVYSVQDTWWLGSRNSSTYSLPGEDLVQRRGDPDSSIV